MDKNIVILEGSIGSDFKYGKTRDGKVFATFTLVTFSYDPLFRDSTENRTETKTRIMVFDARCVEYLQKVKAREGSRVNVFGRVNTHLQDFHGRNFIMTDIIARDLTIIKTNN